MQMINSLVDAPAMIAIILMSSSIALLISGILNKSVKGDALVDLELSPAATHARRRQVPIVTSDDYSPARDQGREDVLGNLVSSARVRTLPLAALRGQEIGVDNPHPRMRAPLEGRSL
jgi:hypothetical protein